MNRLQPLENGQLAMLHNACMKILSKVGVVFHEAEALEIFKNHGFKVDGEKVFFTEDKVLKALETVPSEFTIQARNPEKSVTIGGDHFALGPGWGAPLIIDADGERHIRGMARERPGGYSTDRRQARRRSSRSLFKA